jgi:hypothetical protein
MWAFAFECAEFGMIQSVAAQMIQQYWDSELYPAFKNAEQGLRKGEEARFLCMAPQIMSASWAKRWGGDVPMWSEVGRRELNSFLDMLSLFDDEHGYTGRVLAFSTTRIVRAIAKLAEEVSK